MIDKVKKIYFQHEEIINYLIVGVLTTIVAWTAKFVAAIFLDADIVWQNMLLSFINWAAGVTFGYFANRKYVFKSTDPDMLKEASKFVAGRVSTLILDAVVMFVLVNVLGASIAAALGITTDMVFIGATLFSAVLVMIGNYIFSKLFVFK